MISAITFYFSVIADSLKTIAFFISLTTFLISTIADLLLVITYLYLLTTEIENLISKRVAITSCLKKFLKLALTH
jgi:hypothetical protein